jgi:ATP/maltotriose-dependent transcriptional regulator MalT
MKDLATELRYLVADSENLERALGNNDFVFARRLISAIRETTDNLAEHTEDLAGRGRFVIISVE